MSVRSVFSVYHEGKNKAFAEAVRKAFGEGNFYDVHRGRSGGWRAYDGEDQVLWDGFRYGASSGGFDIDTMTKIVSGVDMEVPSTYGRQVANWSRIDVVGALPLSRTYPKENEEKRLLLCDSFDYVVRYIEEPRYGWVGQNAIAVAVRGVDYPGVDWIGITRLLVGSRELPDEVVFFGTISSMEDVLCAEWSRLTGKRGEFPYHRWKAEISYPQEWANAFCSSHDVIDTWFTDWVKGKDVVGASAALLSPEDSERGAITGIRMTREGNPILCVLVEMTSPLTISQAVEFFAGWVQGLSPVVGDREIVSFIRSVSACGLPPVFAGPLRSYEGVFYG